MLKQNGDNLMKLDILIRNGRVIDPSRKLDKICDIGVVENKIVEINCPANELESVKDVDAKGCYVFPGIIDFHAHIFRTGSAVSVRPDYLLATGVTACVDAGTAGPANFEAFYNSVVVPSQVRIKSYLNTWRVGQSDYGLTEVFDVPSINKRKIVKIVEKYRTNILGLKLRMSEGVATDPKALYNAVEIARELGIGVNVHVSKPMMPLVDIANALGRDDIFCHVYQDAGNDNIFDENGKIKKDILRARERGVIFDAANGKMNFNINACKKAVQQGFWPDIISSDWLEDKYNYSPYTKNLMFILTKYLELGMPIMDAIACVTSTPARLMKMDGSIGTLVPGAFADIAIFKLIDKEAIHLDFDKTPFKTSKLFVPQMVISDGEMAFCQADFALV